MMNKTEKGNLKTMKKISKMLAAGLLIVASTPASAATVMMPGTIVTFSLDLSGATQPFSTIRGNLWVSDFTREFVDQWGFKAFNTIGDLIYDAPALGFGGTGEYNGGTATPVLLPFIQPWDGLGTFQVIGVSGNWSLDSAGMQGRLSDGSYTDVAFGQVLSVYNPPSAVPVPAAVWLFGSGLLGLIGVARRKKS
jgi:hypothetical protein